MELSERHHYIPQFLIKQFVGEDGFLYVYDKEQKEILRHKRSSKQIFFEWNRNTFDIGGVASDNFEKIYSALDGMLASALSNVLTTKILSPENVMSIYVLITTLKNRIPANDSEFNSLKENLTYEDLPIQISPKDANDIHDEEAFNYLINSDLFKESKRFIFPFLAFYKGKELDNEKLLHIHNNCFLNSNDKITSIIGDVPIIEKEGSSLTNLNDVIFPLSNSDTFIFKENTLKGVSNFAFYLNKDLAIIHQSRKYVACKSKQYLEKLIETYNELDSRNQTDLILKYVFEFV